MLDQESVSELTRTGTIVGTPYYMAPEQAKGSKTFDHRVDLYATGVILYEALTGKRPFEGDSYNEIMFKILTEPYQPPRSLNANTPVAVENVVFKAMERDPTRRFASAEEMRKAVDQAIFKEVWEEVREDTPHIAKAPTTIASNTPFTPTGMGAASTPVSQPSTRVSGTRQTSQADQNASARNRVGVAFENSPSAFEAGQRIAKAAMADGQIETPQFALAFCGGDVDHRAFYNGLRHALGPKVPIVGGSAVGLITRAAISYKGYPCGAAVLDLAGAQVAAASVGELDLDEGRAGRRLAEQLEITEDLRTCLLFYDSLKVPASPEGPPGMNASPPLLEGIHSCLPKELPIIGAGLVGHLDLHAAPQLFCGDKVASQQAVALPMRGECRVYTKIMHGCTPLDGIVHTITKAQSPVIFEMCGKPVVEMINGMYGNTDWQKQFPLKRLTIGVNHGEKLGELKEENFVNRLIAGLLPGGDGIVMFEPDLPEGTEVQFMLRDAQKMIDSAKENTAALFDQILTEGRRPLFGLYIDCGGRTALFSETLTEEAMEVVNFFNRYETPLLGFYSGVEIAPLLGQNRGLDWTGVLMMITD